MVEMQISHGSLSGESLAAADYILSAIFKESCYWRQANSKSRQYRLAEEALKRPASLP